MEGECSCGFGCEDCEDCGKPYCECTCGEDDDFNDKEDW